MASLDTSLFDYAMKYYYYPKLMNDLIIEQNDVLRPVFANRQVGGGKRINFSHKEDYGHSTGGIIPTTGLLKTAAGGPGFEGYDTIKIVATTKDVGQFVMNVTKTNRMAYLGALDDMVTEARGELERYMYKYLFNSGGYLAQCESCPSSTTVTLVAGTNMNLFEKGMIISILNKSDGSATNGVDAGLSVISAVNKATRTITITGDTIDNYASVDTTEWVCVYLDVTVDTTTKYIPTGLPDLIGNTTTGPATLHGVTVASHPKWVSYCEDLAGADCTAEDLQRVVDEIELHSPGSIKFLLCSDKFRRRAQFDICEPQQWRPSDEEATYFGVGDPILRVASKNRIPLKVAAYCQPEDDVYFIDNSPDALPVFHAAWTEWMNADGHYLDRVAGYYKYAATMSSEYEFLAVGRSRLGKLYNVAI